MNTSQEREALKKRLHNREHREAFVSACTDQTIPLQIRALRLAKDRNWTQEELAKRACMKQERISACENPNYGKFNIGTLKQLAAAFDVGLIVRFAPFSELIEWEVNMSPESIEVPSFDQEDYFKDLFTEAMIKAQVLKAPNQPVYQPDIYLAINNQSKKQDPAIIYNSVSREIFLANSGVTR